MQNKLQGRAIQHMELGPHFKTTIVVKLWDGLKKSRTGGRGGEQSGGSYNNPRKILNLGSLGRGGHWHSPNQLWGESSCLGRKRDGLESPLDQCRTPPYVTSSWVPPIKKGLLRTLTLRGWSWWVIPPPAPYQPHSPRNYQVYGVEETNSASPRGTSNK